MPSVSYDFKTSGGDKVLAEFQRINVAYKKQQAALDDTGKAAQSALTGIPRLFAEIGNAASANVDKLSRAARAQQSALRLVSTSVNELKGSAQAAVSSLGPLGAGIASLSSAGIVGAATVGLGALGVVLTAGIKKAVDYADALQDQADAVGLTVERYQELLFAARQVGVGQDQLTSLLGKFGKNIGDAEAGTGAFAKRLKDTNPELLKVFTSTASTTEKFDAFAKALINANDHATLLSLGAAGLGKGFTKLAAVFHDGAGGLDELAQKAERTGNVIEGSLVQQGSEASDKLAALGDTISNNLTRALLQAAPLIIKVTDLLEKLAEAANLQFTGGALPVATTGIAGGLTAQIAEQEKALDAFLAKRKAASSQPGPGIIPHDLLATATGIDLAPKNQIDEQIAALTENISKLSAARDAAVAAGKAEKDADDATTRSIAEKTQALDAYVKLQGTLQTKLEKVNAEEKKNLATIAAAVKTGAVDPGDAALQRTRVEQQAAAERKQLTEAANREAEQGARKQKAVSEEIIRLEEQAALAPLEGIAKVEKARDLQIEAYRKRLADQEIGEEDFARARVAIEKSAEADIDDLRKKAAEQAQKDAEKAAADAERDQKKAAADAKDRQDEQQKAAEEAARPFIQAAEDISGSLVDGFFNAFSGAKDQAKSAADTIRDMFINVAEDIAKAFLQKQIFEPLIAQIGGLLAGGGQTTTGTTGGSGILGGLFSLLGLGGESVGTPGVGQQAGGTPVAGPGIQEGAGILFKLLSFVQGGGGTIAGAVPGITSLNEGVIGPVIPEGSVTSANLGQSATGLASYAGLVLALAAATKTIIDSRKSLVDLSLGTSHAGANALTGIQGGLIGGFAAGGAAIGSVFPVVGTIAGAAIGAAIGTAVSQQIASQAGKSIQSGIKEGLSQKEFEKHVVKGLENNTLLMILGAGTDLTGAGPASVFGPLVVPDINKIFGKLFRRAIGGPGGFDTSDTSVSERGIPRGTTGAERGEASTVARFIANAIGAGGEAFTGKRDQQFTRIVLDAAKKRAEETGEDLSTVIAQIYVTAFDGKFIPAMRVIFSRHTIQRGADLEKAATEFGKGTGIDPGFFRLQQQIFNDEGRVPGSKAVKASRAAFGEALKSAFENAADSQAFRKSLTNSVQQAFADAVSSAVIKGPLGEAFASFFSVSGKNRKKLQRARRRRDVPGQLDILEEEFGADSENLAKVIARPEFGDLIRRVTDDFLKLQVALAAATGDMAGVSTAITDYLAPAIQTVAGYQDLERNIKDRVAVALAGPGFAGERERLAQLTRAREAQERIFRAQSGGASVADFRHVLELTNNDPKAFFARFDPTQLSGQAYSDAIKELFAMARTNPELFNLATGEGPGGPGAHGALEALATTDPSQLLARFKAFADARLAELEGELAFLHEIEDTLKAAETAFDGFHETIARTLYTFDAAGDATDKFNKALAAYAEVDFSNIDPDKLQKFTQAMADAIDALVSRITFLRQASESFGDTAQQIGTVLGLRDTAAEYETARADITAHLFGAVAGNEEDITKVQADLARALDAAAERFTFFKQIVEDFVTFGEQIATALQGADASREQLAKRRKLITELIPKATTAGPGQEASADQLRKAFAEAISLATSRLQFFRGAEETFTGTGEQAAVLRRGRRASRQQLATRRAEIESLLPTALGGGAGSEDAIQKLQKLLPEALALGQTALSGGRLRALARYIETASTQLVDVSKAGEDTAKAQLTALETLADGLVPTFDKFKTTAESQLTELQNISLLLKGSTNTALILAYAQLGKLGDITTATQTYIQNDLNAIAFYIKEVQDEFVQFQEDMIPVLDYLGNLAENTLGKQMEHVIQILGPDNGVLGVLKGIAGTYGLTFPDQPAQGSSTSGTTSAARGSRSVQGDNVVLFPGQTASDGSVSVQGNSFHFHFPNAPQSSAQASEYGRTAADAFTQRFLALQRRTTGLRRVA